MISFNTIMKGYFHKNQNPTLKYMLNIKLTDAGVMYEARICLFYLEHLVPFPVRIYYICPSHYLGSPLSLCTLTHGELICL